MKFVNSLLIGILLLTFTQCTRTDEISSELDGEYAGTIFGEWEKIRIENFDTNPDTIFSSNSYTEEFSLTIRGLIYILSDHDEVPSGSLQIKGDSLIFGIATPDCYSHSDCVYILSGTRVRYELDGNVLKLFSSFDWSERQYNYTSKDITRGKSDFVLVRN